MSQRVSERRLTDDGFVRAPTWSRWRRRLIAVAIYAALLAASSMVRARRPVPAPEPGARQIVVTPGTPFVPVPGTPALPPVAMAYTQRCGTDARLNVDPERWNVSREGDGPSPLQHSPIILLHGSPGTRHDFDGLLDALARDRCVIAPDLPGFGGTVGDVPDYGIHAHAAYVEALLDALHVADAHVVGFSMGGGVAIALSRLSPTRVRSLTLLSGLGVQEQELFGRYWVNHAVHGAQLAAFLLLTEATPHFGRFDRMFMGVEYARNFYDTDQRPLRPALLAFDGPALIYHGRHDFLVPYDAALEHHRLLPQSVLVTSDGDHFDTFMRPQEVAAALIPFLAAVDRGDGTTRPTAPAARRIDAERPYTGPVGSAHMGPRLAIEVGGGVVLLLIASVMAWRGRRRRLRLRLK
jgi:pimeloyl-ACP methyl ester carboxylesterase